MDKIEAKKLCSLLNDLDAACTDGPSGYAAENTTIGKKLRRFFPGYEWRVILDRSRTHTRFMLTIDPNDKREHYVPVGGTCIHCGKTAKELRVKERVEDD